MKIEEAVTIMKSANHEPSLCWKLQHTITDALFDTCGQVESNRLLRIVGFKAGMSFAEQYMDLSSRLLPFTRQLQEMFHGLKIGNLRVEKLDFEKVSFALDCSMYEHVMPNCFEAFLAGIMEAYIIKNSVSLCYTVQLCA